jgi:hypothetical protein
MGAHLRALLQHGDRDLGAGRLGQLFEANGRRQARRTRPDDDHVVVHRLAFDAFAHDRNPLFWFIL